MFYVDNSWTIQELSTVDGMAWTRGPLGDRNITMSQSGLAAIGGYFPKVIYSTDGPMFGEARWVANPGGPGGVWHIDPVLHRY